MDRIGVERLCVFGIPPVEFVHLAGDLGVCWIGIGSAALRYYNPDNYPDWSLRDDPQLVREMRAAMAARGVGISLMEGFRIKPGIDLGDYARDMDMLLSLGGTRFNAASLDRDKSRSLDGFATLAEMADERGLQMTIEIAQPPNVNLTASLETLAYVNRHNFKLLIDTMHYFRFGGSIAEMKELDPSLIGYIQLADAPLASRFDSYLEEALHDRIAPGDGELPLRAFLELVPRDVIVSVEIPQRALALAGIGPAERVERCVAGARKLLPEG